MQNVEISYICGYACRCQSTCGREALFNLRAQHKAEESIFLTFQNNENRYKHCAYSIAALGQVIMTGAVRCDATKNVLFMRFSGIIESIRMDFFYAEKNSCCKDTPYRHKT